MSHATRLWKERLAAHMKIVSRYTVFAGQSGFFLFLFVAFIASSYLYGKSLGHIPEAFPYGLVLTCWLLPFLTVSPIRTLLRQADLVFLLPMEAEMGGYFRRSLLYSFVTQSFVIIFAVSASMPLYRHGLNGEQPEPYIVMAALALALKFANLLSQWIEGSLARAGYRTLIRSTRWMANSAIVYALYRFGSIAAAVTMVLAIAAIGLWVRSLRRVPVNWTYLRAKENSHNTTMLLFFNWFVDVEQLPNRVKARATISKLANLIPFRQEYSFRYLYALTLFRSELFGIMVRLTLIAFLILLVVEDPLLFAAVYTLFQIVTNVQLSVLGRFHRHSVWPALYPIAASQRIISASRVAFSVQFVQLVLLALPMFRSAVFDVRLLLLPPLAVLLAYAIYLRRSRSN